MKNLTKIFMAVVALFAVSCATDLTEDLGVNLGEGQTTTISVSLEESRTHLGTEKDGEYPLYWSEGDKIAVNGVASNALSASAHGQQSATFTLNGAIGFPRTIVYPAPAEGVKAATAGQYPVTFAATQSYKAGSFAEGAAPMYAYQEEGEGITLQHLSGVLRFAPYGEGVTLKALTVTAETGALSGNFDVDAEGNLTAHADATGSVTITFGDGLALGTDATPIYVAVPAGEFGKVTVTLYTNSGSMVRQFQTNGNAINAGKVREFPAFAFEANGEAGDDFLIYDEASLREFSTKASTTASAKVVANVDMSGKEWSAIEGFAGTFDGGNHEIKGLTAPLFGETSASFKGLHLTGVNINETELPTVGALARKIVTLSVDNYPTVEHCSVSGSIVVNCENYEVVKNDHETLVTGGLVGYTSGVTFRDCVNKAKIDVKQYAKTGNTQNTTALIGGVLGCSGAFGRGDETYQATSLINCENEGDIKLGDKSYTGEYSVEGNGTFPKIAVWIGGVLGGDLANSTEGVETNLVNRGNITIDAYTEGAFVGGVVGHSYAASRDGFQNYGKITIERLISTRLLLGGIVSCIQSNTLSNSHNYGAIEVKYGWGRELYLGGVIGMNKSILNECENSGTITLNFEIGTRSAAYSAVKHLAIGGVAGELSSSANEMNNCKNNATGDIVATGKFFNGNAKLGYYGIGGVAGVMVGKVTNSVNDGDITVNATTTYVAASTGEDGKEVAGNKTTAALHIGGALGTCLTDNYSTKTANNSGNITVAGGTYGGPLHVAGLVGYSSKRFGGVSGDNATNSGKITLCSAEENSKVECQYNIRLAGCIGQTDANITELDNTGAITVNAGLTVAGTATIAGVTAKVAEANNPIARINNTGDITLNGGTYNGRLLLGGIVSEFRHQYLVDATNSGDITIKNGASFSHSESSNIGGIAGIGVYHATNKNSFKRSVNSGNITIENGVEFKQLVQVAGGIALVSATNNSPLPVENVVNNGEIKFGGSTNNRVVVGGVFADSSAAVGTDVVGVTNNGKISTTNTVSAKEMVVGGVTGLSRKALRNATNNGEVEVSGKVTTFLRTAGAVAWIVDLGTRNIANSKAITIKGDIEVGGQSHIGGLVGFGQAQITIGTNTGNVIVEEGAQLNGQILLGGIMGELRTGLGQCNNSGNITVNIEGAEGNNNYIGGAVGYKVNAGLVQNTRVFSTIKAIGHANVGMLMGNPYNSGGDETVNNTTNCHVGGSIKTDNEEPEPIDHEDFHLYIYGDETVFPTELNASLCGCLPSKIDDDPVDSEGNKIE